MWFKCALRFLFFFFFLQILPLVYDKERPYDMRPFLSRAVWPLKANNASAAAAAAARQHGWHRSIWQGLVMKWMAEFLRRFFEPASVTVPHREHAGHLGYHLASRPRLIFFEVHIIHVGTLWSAAELSVHKTAQERKLEDSDKAACPKTAQMTGEDKSRKQRGLCIRWF